MARPTSRREQSKAETRAKLMAAARREFARKGYAGTSLRTITGRAGLTTGAFYNNFRDKKEIYLAILEEMSLKIRNLMEETIQEFFMARLRQPKNSPTLDLLRLPLSRFFRESIRDRDLFEIVRRDSLVADSEFRAHYRRILEEIIEPMRKGLEGYVEAGLARPYNTEALARVAVILFFSVVLYASYERRSDLEGWVDTIAAMIHGGAKQLSARRPLAGSKKSDELIA
ncbi:MAG: TetR/AcrR family transcriptional regulator [bacterium]